MVITTKGMEMHNLNKKERDMLILKGADLDSAVASALGMRHVVIDGLCVVNMSDDMMSGKRFSPSSVWSDGGPIIESYSIGVEPTYGYGDPGSMWCAKWVPLDEEEFTVDNLNMGYGETPLIAAMRTLVAMKTYNNLLYTAALSITSTR